ncbi:hypothetical protein GCM10010269_61290 [Streptomyces humidus]|uniref:Regulatory protein n=1 Tax=Streptomyces humidus TaxID=52259 RepID=A0A918L6I1_9ACTN|nr:DUF6191 domain-containing protein [Streptomyces humidus]GGS13761.1 hypothetical protein GCM10010269_61290 [Streptomyces humidus]
MFDPFEELFAPGRKHTRDEQNRLELTREDVGDADPGHGPIDLSSGKVVVRAAGPGPAGEKPTAAEPAAEPNRKDPTAEDDG